MFRRRQVQSAENITDDLVQEVVKLDAKIRSLIQEVEGCDTSFEDLNRLSAAAREAVATERRALDRLQETARSAEPEQLTELMKQADIYSQQLKSCQIQLRRASIIAQSSIEKRNSEELLSGPRDYDLTKRKQAGKEELLRSSSQMTDNLRSISRQLAAQVDRSKQTLDVLVTSSEKMGETGEELKGMGGVIGQSRKLLNKYGRREQTDNILFVLALAFFFACVLYVVKNRTWGW